MPRARGEIRADFVAHGVHTRVGRLYETGGLRLRFPKEIKKVVQIKM